MSAHDDDMIDARKHYNQQGPAAELVDEDEADDENAVDYLRSPFGNEITDVVVATPGLCGILFNETGVGESGLFDYDGTGTSHDYDSSKEIVRAGQRVFQDDAGNEWLEGELVKPGQPLPSIVTSAWDEIENIVLFLHEKIDEVSKVIMEDRHAGHMAPLQKVALDNHALNLARVLQEIRFQNQPK